WFQVINRVEYVHSRGFLREIKPDNFLMGLGCRANLKFPSLSNCTSERFGVRDCNRKE
ncbi:hypothetical protein MKX01_018772, partial [Papaver californicum]